jgi:hypothetical protein
VVIAMFLGSCNIERRPHAVVHASGDLEPRAIQVRAFVIGHGRRASLSAVCYGDPHIELLQPVWDTMEVPRWGPLDGYDGKHLLNSSQFEPCISI